MVESYSNFQKNEIVQSIFSVYNVVKYKLISKDN